MIEAKRGAAILSLKVLKRIALVLPEPAKSHMRRSVEIGWEMARFAPPGAVALRLALRPRRRILTYPDTPSRYQVLFKLCALNGYRLTTDPDAPHDIAFHFQYHLEPCTLPASVPVVNRFCADVSKRRVAEVFEEVFGYALAVSPESFEGKMVEKPDGNHTFDGRVLQGPLRDEDIDPERVYERHIDTVIDGEAVDFRTPIYGREIPLVYDKRRPQSAGLKDIATSSLRDPEDVFSPSERENLLAFAQAMGLDYGELDVLRDVNDGRIYVVDVNNTPAGPAKQMTDAEITSALKRLTPSFDRLLDFVAERDRKPSGSQPV